MKLAQNLTILALLLTGTFWVPASVFGQRQANDSCKNATILPIGINPVYQTLLSNVGTLDPGLPTTYNCNIYAPILPRMDVWYKSTCLTRGVIMSFKVSGGYNPLIEIYHGSCGSLVYDTCTTITRLGGNADSLQIILDYPAGTTFFIRAMGFSRTQSNPIPFQLALSVPIGARRVISKKVTASWDSNSTWVGNVKPNYNDTVIIDDGATITAAPDRIPLIGKLIVGQTDTAHKANLVLNYNGAFTWYAPDSLLVRKQGNIALRALQPNSQGDLMFAPGKYFKLDGKLIADTNTNYHNSTIYFKNAGKQVMDGLGNLVNDWDVTVSKSQKDTVIQRIPWQIRRYFVLDSGIIRSEATIGFHSKPTDRINTSEYCNLYLTYGSIINGHLSANSFCKFSTFSNFRQPDQPKDLNPYFISNIPIIFKHNRQFDSYISGNKTIHYNGGYSSAFPSTMSSLITGSNTDTLIIGKGVAKIDSWSRYRNNAGFAVGTMVFDPRLVPTVEDTNYLPLFRFGAFRQIKIINSKPFTTRAQTLGVTVLPQAPNGTVNAPLKYMFGSFVYKIHSNRDSLPAASSLGFLFTPRDSFITSPTYLRIAQAPTPSGPWTSVSTGTINASHLITNTSINLQNGQYFAFGTVDPGQDLALDWVETTTPALTGPGMPGQNMQMQIRNPSSAAATEALVTWTIASPTPITGSSTITLNPPLQGGDSTIINLNPADLIYVPYTGKFKYTVALGRNTSNTFLGPADTNVFYVDNRPHTLPYTQNFDSVPYYQLPPQYRSTPPNLWHYKHNPFGPDYFNTGTRTLYGVVYNGKTQQLLTEPVLLPAGKVYIKIDAGSQSGFFPGDTIRFAVTLDSGKTYQTYRDIDIGTVSNPVNTDKETYQDSITITNLVKAHLKITLKAARGISFEASRLRFSTTPLTSTLPDLRPGEIALYPNPAQTGSFKIAGLDKEATVSLSTLTGQTLSTQTLNPDSEFSVPDLPTGLYLVKIVSPDRTKVVKWVVER